MREFTTGDHRSRADGTRLRLRRPARLAGRRPLRDHRLGAVVAHQLLADGGARVRAAERGHRARGGRCVALDALRRRRHAARRRSWPGRWPPSACRRSSSRTASACSPSTAASRGMAGHPAAHGPWPRHPLPRGLRSPARPGAGDAAPAASARRSPAACASASLVPVVSDFLFDEAPAVVRELARVNVVHDVFLVRGRQPLRLRHGADRRPAGSRCATSKAGRRA